MWDAWARMTRYTTYHLCAAFAVGCSMQDHDSEPWIPIRNAIADAIVPSSTRIVVDAAEAFNYAAWQNAVPLLRRVEIVHPGEADLSSLVVELRASPAFVRPRSWTVDRIVGGRSVVLRDVDIEVDPEFLDRLDESERGVLTFRLSERETVLHEVSQQLRILARDEWGGLAAMGGILPAFVTPNEPAVASLLKAAGTLLGESGHSSDLEGYQSQDPNRSYLLAAALWSAVAAKKLTYANPPASFEAVGQKVRSVSAVLSDGLATCLDSTLLFASGLEAMGLNPVIIMTRGHCFSGVWLVDKTFARLLDQDGGEVRKAIAARELVVFETTLVTRRPPASFADAVASAIAAVSIEKEGDFVGVIDVKRARISEIRPLASRRERQEQATEEAEAEALPLPISPGFDKLAAPKVEDSPRTPAGRIERWQRKLLDLSLRNRLLNFRPSKQIVPVLCPDLSRLEDQLANGSRVRLVSLPDANPIGPRDALLHQRRTARDLDLEFARTALARNELACPLNAQELDQRLTTLYRNVRNDLAEGGSNTLFLAVGFLRWKPQGSGELSYRAPLLLVPVELIRRSASSPFYLACHEDDTQFNATLLQLLKKDFDCQLAPFESGLPMDDSGVCVPQVLDRMRQAVREMPGFEVVEEAAIATFSFAKYLMWRDLSERIGQLEHNRVVRHLIQSPDQSFSSGIGSPAPRPREIDTRYAPRDLVHPLPADSSQLAAVMAAAEGHDLVIVGPPGTGKSQTIANLIAQCLAAGKTVLFVAEKTAALDVVHRRLRENGLGDCCVELHSNKAERRRFLDQLDAAWKNRRRSERSDWEMISERLRIRRDQLNEYVASVHAEYPNGWTVHRAMGECVRGRESAVPRLDWPSTVEHDENDYDALEAAAGRLVSTFQSLNTAAGPLQVGTRDWSFAWESGFINACQRLVQAAESLQSAAAALDEILGRPATAGISASQLKQYYRLGKDLADPSLPPRELTLRRRSDDLSRALAERSRLLHERSAADASWRQSLTELLGDPPNAAEGEYPADALPATLVQLILDLSQPNLPPSALVFHPQFGALEAGLSERKLLLRLRDEAREALVARSYSRALVDRMPVDQVVSEWMSAAQAFWPMSLWKSKSLERRLLAFMSPGGSPAPEVDVPLWQEYQESGTHLQNNLATLALPADWLSAVEQDVQSLDGPLDSARRLRAAMEAAGLSPEALGRSSQGNVARLGAAAKQVRIVRTELSKLEKRLGENFHALGLSPELASLVRENAEALDEQITRSDRLRETLTAALGDSQERQVEAFESVWEVPESRRVAAAKACWLAAKAFHHAWKAFADHAEQTPASSDSQTVVSEAAAAAREILERRGELKAWTAWRAAEELAVGLGMSSFVEAVQTRSVDARNWKQRFRLAYARWWLPTVVDRVEPVRSFQKRQHEEAVVDFQHLDDLARKAAAPQVLRTVCHDLPAPDVVPRKSELGLLRHQLSLKRPSRSIRDMISGMPASFSKLAPCLLMSPLSIAQYLPAEHPPFDVVVFDEASQIATWDAIGAIARGRQTIIVGDPKQLPPTNFFGRTDDERDAGDIADYEQDLESILDEAQASGLPTLQLNWHYRSRHESLIAFSNVNYYGNQLVTFPAAESADRGVSLRHVQGATYDRGRSRTNRVEAEAIVDEAVQRMRRSLRLPEKRRPTFGIVTFNSQQQTLIQDLLDAAQRQHPELDWYFADDRIESTVVKNLENVQGDERDVIMFSITFGFDAAGKFPIDFGAVNREGGERRLNVAITRARRELLVFSSFLPDQLRAERSNKRGVRDLKAFLQYAEKGPTALVARTDGSEGDYESPLEEAVGQSLRSRGWKLDPQVGISGFRIDLGLIHPDKPGAYLAGIECDGATYHRAAAARDRDKVRQQVLEGLGWRILRVWSTDWWYDPIAAVERLDSQLRELLDLDRRIGPSGGAPSSVGEAVILAGADAVDLPVDSTPNPAAAFEEEPVGVEQPLAVDPAPAASAVSPTLVARKVTLSPQASYPRVELKDATANQDRFFDDDYSDTLKAMARTVLVALSPVRDETLVREVARVHGFARTGHRIKQRVLELLSDVCATDEYSGRFLWAGPAPEDVVPFRYPHDERERRSLDEIATAELFGLVRELPALSTSDDPVLVLARELGLARLSSGARERLEAVWEISNGADE